MEETRIFKEKESKVGPLIGSLIIIVVLVVGAIYFLGQRIAERKLEINEEQKKQEEVSKEMNSLEQEVNQLNIDGLDNNIADIEKEFDSN